MWNLFISFDDCCQTVRELLELEYRYACRMAVLEKRSLHETIVYTEYPLYCEDVPQHIWEKRLGTAAEREALWHDTITPWLRIHYEKAREEIANNNSCFLSELHTEYYCDSPELLLTLHFRNLFAPDSPFNHLDALCGSLLDIVERHMAVHPEITRVQCASWLNNRPEFLALFPAEWQKQRSLCLPMEGSTGWWGSFIDRRGLFNAERAADFERLGGFAMPNTNCRCSTAALLQHLQKMKRA